MKFEDITTFTDVYFGSLGNVMIAFHINLNIIISTLLTNEPLQYLASIIVTQILQESELRPHVFKLFGSNVYHTITEISLTHKYFMNIHLLRNVEFCHYEMLETKIVFS
jgi:hypothetical protein